MNELTERLTLKQPIIMGGADPSVEELRNRTGEMGYVLVKFTQTRGGTELGFPLDRAATDLSKANFDESTGTVHVSHDPTPELGVMSVYAIRDPSGVNTGAYFGSVPPVSRTDSPFGSSLT